MLIKLRQSEIEDALHLYVASQGIDLSNKSVSIDFTNSRGNDGLTADFDIGPVNTSTAPVAPIRGLTSGEIKEKEAEAVAEEPAEEPAAEAVEETEQETVPAKSLFG